tara:strand:- start:794 stop:1054 length:261 start_codon:yes stop_codon:yes gene_type:complete
MYMLTLKDRTTDGAYAIADKNGEKVLLMFEETDDAERYAMYLETDEKYANEMVVVEVDDELAVKTCKINNYKYSIVTPNDFVLPIL